MKRKTSTLSPVDKVLCLQGVDVFKHATTEMLAFIGSIAEEIELPEGGAIFMEEDVSDAMYVVVKGRVCLQKGNEEVMTVDEGHSFGTWALFDRQPRFMTAIAVDSVHLLRIRSDDFYELLSDHEEIIPVMFRAIVDRVKTLIPV